MVKMISEGSLVYAKRALVAGDEFTAESEEHAKVLTHIGKAKRKDMDETRQKRQYKRRDLTPEE